MAQKLTPPQLKKMKEENRKIVMATAYDYPSALLTERAGVDVILVGDSLGMVVLGYKDTVSVTMEEMIHHTKAVVRGAPGTLVAVDMPFGSYQASPRQAVENAIRMVKETGADAVKVEGGTAIIETVKAIIAAGIPVVGHVGLTPQSATALGGFKVQGKTPETAKAILEDAVALDQAGVCCLVIECVPAELGRLITRKVSTPTIGIGAGVDCDGQVLVYHDILGLYDRFVPKFVKQYAQLAGSAQEAIARYAQEVRERQFPAPEHGFTMDDEVLKSLY